MKLKHPLCTLLVFDSRHHALQFLSLFNRLSPWKINGLMIDDAAAEVDPISQEASGVNEGYHLKLKPTLNADSHIGSLQRVDWLVHKLNTELHPSHWSDRCADEIFFSNC
ncbi:hypothetical protein C5167_012095 [Papaver somniferum]|uniref:Uncharacterized protein n=1 Tax=Papaver somniferum TaxID=3469 RepID=A0A4Y7IZU7_PAPSO|nr:hypothetical protein C5167_012095 [Papaver somniferum]